MVRPADSVGRVAGQSFEIVTHSQASPEAVFAVVADAARWSEWAGPLVPRSALERPGAPEPNGVGAIRKLGSPPFWSREEIVEHDPPGRLAYVLRSGLPVRHYRSVVDLSPTDGGTTICWRSSFEPALAGTGRVMRAILRRTVAGFARRLAAHAARPAA